MVRPVKRGNVKPMSPPEGGGAIASKKFNVQSRSLYSELLDASRSAYSDFKTALFIVVLKTTFASQNLEVRKLNWV